MTTNLGYVPASSTIYLAFTTHAQTGAAVAPLSGYEAADVQLYKNGSATQRSSTSGWTMTSPFDSITGLHLLAIDLSDNTDSGFYAAGNFYTAVLSADTETVDGLTVVAVIGTFFIGPVQADVRQLLGTAWLSPGTAGTPDVNVKLLGGTSQTGRDIGASVLLSAGSGTGQLDFTSGVVKANLAQILGTALTETAGQIAAGFKKFFNIATPAATMDHGVLVDTVTTYTGNTPQTGDAYARLGAPAGASVSADVAAVKTDSGNLITRVGTPSDLGSGASVAKNLVDIEGQTDDIGAAGAGLTGIPDSAGTTTLLSRLSATRAGYLDNLSAGAVALEASLQGLITTIGASAAGVATAVWGAATRLLTAGTNIVLAKGTGITGFNDLSAAQVNAEADTALADYDAPTKAELDSAVAPLALEATLGTPADGDIATDIANVQSAVDGLNDLDATAVQTAASAALTAYDGPTHAEMTAELASADDAVLAAIAALENLSASDAADAVGALAIEGAVTLIQSLRLSNAAAAGKLSGAAGTSIKLRDLADTLDRITATVDSDGNRTAVTRDLS